MIYRIGGDEFVAILEGNDDTIVDDIIARYNSIADKKNENRYDGIQISASIGKAYGAGRNIEDIVKKLMPICIYRRKNIKNQENKMH